MADLTRAWTWERWVPRLGDNAEAKSPFYLEVASGLTKEALVAFQDEFGAAMAPPPEAKEGEDRWRTWAEQMAAVFGRYVRLGKEPLRLLNDKLEVVFEVKVLADLLVVLLQGPKAVIFDLSRAIATYNTLGGQLELFYERHSGGTSTTPEPSAVKDEGQQEHR